jgi:hypothetical protein
MSIKTWLGLCEHRWKIIHVVKIVDEDEYLLNYNYTLQCIKCGLVKRVKI